MDFRRFASDEVVSFNRLQTDIIRHTPPAPIAHNYMGRVTEFRPFRHRAPTSISPLGQLSRSASCPTASPRTAEHKRRFVRQGDPDFQAFHHDLYRAVGRGRWWIMEQQPGPVNWAPYNPDPLPGMARLWAWEAFAHGAEAVCYFRWRQAPFAQEQMHAGLSAPRQRPRPGLWRGGTGRPRTGRDAGCRHRAGADVALIFDYASDWAWEIQPQGRDFSYFRLVFHIYKGLRRLGLNVDILPPDTADLSAYKLVLAPGLVHPVRPPESRPCRASGHGDPSARAPIPRPPNFAIPVPLPPNLPGLDAHVTRVESLPPDVPVPLAEGGNLLHWREKLEGTATVVEMAEDGWPALILRAACTIWRAGPTIRP